jgi:hypothetical protein
MKPRSPTLRAVAEAIKAVVKDCPDGVPADALYLGVVDYCSLRQFDIAMAELIRAGWVRRDGNGHCFPGPNYQMTM